MFISLYQGSCRKPMPHAPPTRRRCGEGGNPSPPIRASPRSRRNQAPRSPCRNGYGVFLATGRHRLSAMSSSSSILHENIHATRARHRQPARSSSSSISLKDIHATRTAINHPTQEDLNSRAPFYQETSPDTPRPAVKVSPPASQTHATTPSMFYFSLSAPKEVSAGG
ncbi:uncharacterized protein LOC127854885 [Dreissena polymorpha]|uniref:uncharacterized protein LOC127854885 n=1 Tax=Dreissena polymorpha TaxID=45954 RepID=UPI00226537BC|nr:uncharacterized protein LOC127854885 [Dreissena polymorpha]